MVKWREFQQNYLVEVETFSTVNIQFDDNTPLFTVRQPSIRKIMKARVLDKRFLKTIREYPIELDSLEIRTVENKLRKLIMRDFQIVESVMPPRFSEIHQAEQEFYPKEPQMYRKRNKSIPSEKIG